MKYIYTNHLTPVKERLYDQIIQMRKEGIVKNQEVMMTFPLKVMIKYCVALLSPNETGFKIAKYIIFQSDMKEVPQGKNRGDAKFLHDGEIKYTEIKVSILGSSSQNFTVRNIRPWHQIDYYTLCFITDPNEDPMFFCVYLDDLLKKFHPSFMAGTLNDNKYNQRSNLGLVIPNREENLFFLK
jgi:hypothetical protein